jgi:oligopeptide transport system permease protein
MIPLLWGVATITFFLMHLVPGGPFDREKDLPEATKALLERKYNLDEPLHKQYVLYLWNLAHGDLGTSFTRDQEVRDIIRDGFGVSAQLGLTAFTFAVVVGMSLGIISALNQNRLGDYVGVAFATVGASMPNFVVATLGVLIFSVQLGWLDVLGWGGPSWGEFYNPFAWNFRKVVLPVLSLGLLPAAYVARITRASMLEVLRQDYIRVARAKGLPEHRVVLRHAVKNALIPVLTVAGPIFAILVTGSFIVERIFGIPGMGRPFVESVFRRDYGIIMGTTIFFATIVAFVNLIVDVLYAVVDPRIRYG